MGLSVVVVPAGGLPVIVSTNGYGLPCTISTNGYGVPVTQSTNGSGLAVIGVSFGPTIQLSAASVLETAAVNTVVGTLSVSPGTTGSPVFALVDSAGGKFNISGTSLRTNAALDYETATFHTVIVSVTGVSPTVANATFTILVTDVVEPVILLTGTTVNENATAGTNIGVLSIGNSFTGTPAYTLVDSSSGKVAISGSNLNVLGAIDYETTPTFNITVSVSGITPAAPNKVFTVVVSDVVEGGGVTTPPATALWGWWDAEHAYTEVIGTPATLITTDGTSIGSMADRSGAGHHIYQGSAAATYKTSILNAKPAARFSNTATSNMRSIGNAPTGNNFSMYVVCNQTTRTKNYDGLIANNDGTLTPRWSILNNTSGDTSLRVFTGTTAAVAGSFSASTYHLVGATVDNTGAFPTTLQVDNNTIATAAGGGGNLSEVQIGVYFDGYWTGDILEILFYTATHNLASGDGLIARQYLDTKYNLGLGLGGGAVGTTKNIVSDYGAVGDAQWAQATLSITTNILTSATAIWPGVAGSYVGKTIVVGIIGGASPQGGGTPLVTTITGWTSSTQITLGAPAQYALASEPNVIVAWGTSSKTAFDNFRAAYQGQSVTLTIPAGGYLVHDSGPIFDGIKNLTVNATGATICGGLFNLGSSHQYQFKGASAYTAAASSGATSVTLITPADVSRFAVGRYVMLTGFALQYGGFPTNHQLFEYLKVIAIDSDSGSPTYGKITFLTPLVNSYLTTWPLYEDEITSGIGAYSHGGPATLYALDAKFDHTCVINGLTVAHHPQMGVSGLDLTFNNCTFASIWGPHVTVCKSVVLNGCLGINCSMEVDKLITAFTMNGCDWGGLTFQSTCVTSFIMDDTDIRYSVVGTPWKATIRNGSTIGTISGIGGLTPGPTYGYPNQLIVSDSQIKNFGKVTTHDCGNVIIGGTSTSVGCNVDFTMSGGVIRIPSTYWPLSWIQQWTVTGARLFWLDENLGTIGIFTITNVTKTGSETLVTTNKSGGFPPRTYPANGLRLIVHPAPICTFTNVTGCPEVVDLSNAGAAGLALYSYSKRIYDGSVAVMPYWPLYGRVKKVVVIVTQAYTGAFGGSVFLEPNVNVSDVFVKMSDYTNATWAPVIDLRKTGTRTFDATAGTYPVSSWSSTAVAASDTLPGMTEALWAPGSFRPTMTDISAEAAGVRPIFSIEVITDQS